MLGEANDCNETIIRGLGSVIIRFLFVISSTSDGRTSLNEMYVRQDVVCLYRRVHGCYSLSIPWLSNIFSS